MGALALIEILDRDGSVRHSQKVHQWPLRVGRSLDNDLVLDDPHVAAHHFTVDANDDGVFLAVGDTVNGVAVGHERLRAGDRWQAATAPSTVVAGRTHLRLRLPAHALPAEAPLARTRVHSQGLASLLLLALLNVLVLCAATYLESDPEPLLRALATVSGSGVTLVAVWCGGWTLLSKLFTRQGHFRWHVRVLMTAMLAWAVLEALLTALAFAFSWPALTGYAYWVEMLVMSAGVYLHLQAVEPHRPVVTRAFALASFVVAVGLTGWGHWQRSDTLRSDLYNAALLPPAFRLAKPVSTEDFLSAVETFQADLDEKARKQPAEDEGSEEADLDE